MRNVAFIDSQNLYKGISDAGWQLDYRKFRVWLKNKYAIDKAILFFGYIEDKKNLYKYLEKCGFTILFRNIEKGKEYVKGNVDVDMTIHAVYNINMYEKGFLITSDGDFYSLVMFMKAQNKFGGVISPHEQTCSRLLRKSVGGRITFLDHFQNKLS